MVSHDLFTKTARLWFYTLIFANHISLFFVNTLTQGNEAYSFSFATMVCNIVISYLVILFMFLNYRSIMAEEIKPFHRFVWFDCSLYEKWAIIISFAIWMLVNFIHLFYMKGLGYFQGVFFIFSAFYWSMVMGAMYRSYKNYQQVNLET